MSKFILVTSGVCSSLGKGVATAAIGSLLESSGLKIEMMKCDPYINIDAGTISPYQHGEVFVTEDGAETDSDLGNFARFTSVKLTNENLVTIGKVYEAVIRNERAGRFNGRTVQVIPHITDEIKRRILAMGSKTGADVVIVEIGGTVGDIESIPYLEVARQLSHELGKSNCMTIHMALIPTIIGGELKSKPTQQSVKKLQETGIQPDILLCRCDRLIDEDMRKKIAMFCNVGVGSVFTSTDIEKSVYELPILFHEQGMDKKIMDKLGLSDRTPDIKPWKTFVEKLKKPERKVTVAMVGKKDYLDDCFKSVRESLFHAAVTDYNADVEIKKIDAESLEEAEASEIYKIFEGIDAIVIPGNYGQRGFLGEPRSVPRNRPRNAAHGDRDGPLTPDVEGRGLHRIHTEFDARRNLVAGGAVERFLWNHEARSVERENQHRIQAFRNLQAGSRQRTPPLKVHIRQEICGRHGVAGAFHLGSL